MEHKFCSGCKKDLPISSFSKRKTSKRASQPVSKCKKCRVSVQRSYKERRTASGGSVYRDVEWPSKLRRLYGIEPEDYSRMLEAQCGGCAICGSTTYGYNGKEKFAVDHCHETGKVRGLLCGPCNKGLGLFRDDIKTMNRAIAYLRANGQE